MNGRRTMCRERDGMSIGEGGNIHKSCHSATAGRIGLQNIDRLGRQHLPQRHRIPAVLASRDLHTRGAEIAHHMSLARSSEETGSSNHHIAFGGKAMRKRECLLSRVAAVSVHKEIRISADRLAGRSNSCEITTRVCSDLHLDSRNTFLNPA